MSNTSDENLRLKAISQIKFVVDRLPEGYTYPCSISEIKQILARIPIEHLKGIKRIRLSAQKAANADASYFNGTINIYSIPMDMKFIFPEKPPEAIVREYSRFGARWEVLGEHWYCYWRPESFKKYILEHVLFHELGHHIDDYLSLRRSFGKEKFAERYALNLEKKIRNERTM